MAEQRHRPAFRAVAEPPATNGISAVPVVDEDGHRPAHIPLPELPTRSADVPNGFGWFVLAQQVPAEACPGFRGPLG